MAKRGEIKLAEEKDGLTSDQDNWDEIEAHAVEMAAKLCSLCSLDKSPIYFKHLLVGNNVDDVMNKTEDKLDKEIFTESEDSASCGSQSTSDDESDDDGDGQPELIDSGDEGEGVTSTRATKNASPWDIDALAACFVKFGW